MAYGGNSTTFTPTIGGRRQPARIADEHPEAAMARRIGDGLTVYAVIFSVRCGSTLLCEDLTTAGLGWPCEFFQHSHGFPQGEFLGYTAVDLCDYLKKITNDAPNRLFGFKVNWYQAYTLQTALRQVYGTETDLLLSSLFPGLRVIYAVRRDKVLQAISAWRAERTNVWHRRVDETAETGGGTKNLPAYDFEYIRLKFNQILAEEWIWEQQFAYLGVEPLTIVYEEYIQNRVAGVRRVAESLQREIPGDYVPSQWLIRLQDDYSLEIRSRFLNDLKRNNGRLLDRFEQHFTFSDR
jgi:LPS sulfotransferase NodH